VESVVISKLRIFCVIAIVGIVRDVSGDVITIVDIVGGINDDVTLDTIIKGVGWR
jgi:hypothetical protein